MCSWVLCVAVGLFLLGASIFMDAAELPFFPLPEDRDVFAKPCSIVYAISNELYDTQYSPTGTQREFWLSTNEISVMREATITSNDAMAAARLFAYYILSRRDVPQQLRWLTMTAYIGGVTEAVENVEMIGKVYQSNDLAQVFGLSGEQICVLNEAVVSNDDASAAFRLALYYAIIVGDADAKAKCMTKAATLGCHGAQFYMAILNRDCNLSNRPSGIGRH